jgi:hypothetical protein
MKTIAIATCVKLPELDPDQEFLSRALRDRGATHRMLAWDDPNDAARSDEIVVVRSTWNYFHSIGAFLLWADRTSSITTLLNPATIIRTNARKTYLRDLESAGTPIVPTLFVMRGERSDQTNLQSSLPDRGWKEIVIKPVVSAGSFLTQRFDVSRDCEAAESFLMKMLGEGHDAMVQEWMPSVEGYGERSLIWIDGEITHAIRKSPRFIGGSEAVSQTEVPIAKEERDFAMQLIEPLREDLLYARVDLVKDERTNVLRLMELEMIEPSLFLKQSAKALDRLVSAMIARANQ